MSTPLFINGSGDYVERFDSDATARDLKPLVTDAIGTPMRRIARFIQLALIGAGRCAKQVELPKHAAVYLGSGRGDLEVTVEVMQGLWRDGQAPKPLSFINTVSNAACFYVAQGLQLMGRSSFVCNRYFAFETMLQLAALDLESACIDTALVGTVDVVVAPLAAHRIRLGIGTDLPVADASHWLLLQRQSSATTLGQLLAAEHFVDADGLRAWLQRQARNGEWRLATGQFISEAEASTWQRELGLATYEYRIDRPYYDSQTGAVAGEFLRSEKGTLLHLNRDPSGRYSAFVVRAGSAE